MEGDFLNVEDMTEEDINAILGLGTAEEEGLQLEGQLAQALKLRNKAGPEGRGYGGVYTAANPLEHAVHAWQGIRAGKDAERISSEQDALMAEQTAARKKFFDAMIRRQGQSQAPQEGYGPQPFDPSQVY
jgi:hypothetical protein